MRTLSVDIETFSSVDLLRCGVYRYAEAPDFAVLLLAYAFDDEPIQLVDFASGETLPVEVLDAFTDPTVIKTAYNANFELTCLQAYIKEVDFARTVHQWCCTAVHAATLGLPRSLGAVAEALRLPQEKQKLKEGKDLIRYFSLPCKPTKSNGGRTRNLPHHAPEKWAAFKAYCVQDVEVEREIRRRLARFPVPEIEQKAWEMDQRINQRGVRVDRRLVDQAIRLSTEHTELLTAEAICLTGLSNPNSVSQLKDWLGVVESLNKKSVAAMRLECADAVKDRVLAIRQELGKTSVSKYEAIQRSVCRDGRVRGLFQFYGANRTGRWAGRLVQVQNLPQNHLPDLALAREVVLDGDREGLEMLFGNVPATLSELIRTAFVPRDGYVFVVADFSAIEARVIAWLAGEKWRMDVFAGNGKIYEASAERMFHLPEGSVKKGDPMRQKGKIAELALGYGGSVGALTAMGALEMGLAEKELKPLVYAWRQANPAIVALWETVGSAAMETVRLRSSARLPHGIRMRYEANMLHIKLPSGREMRYVRPRIVDGKYGEVISYESTEAGKWGRAETYGPKLVENIVQALARDCLRDALIAVELRYPEIVMHVHDEMVVEVPRQAAEVALKDICAVMGRGVEWAPGLLLRGDGYITRFYRKD